MSSVSQVESMAAMQSAVQTKEAAGKDNKKTGRVSGKTVGNVQVSEKAAKYYEQLKAKFSDKEFVLVSSDMKEQAKAHAASFANPNKMVVLIDDEKLEKMAEDENYRAQYEGIIANASSGMAKLQNSLAGSGAKVKGFGMQINDNGLTSFFAVLDKAGSDQRARLEKKAQEKKEAKKAQEKKDKKTKEQERLEEKRKDKTHGARDEELVTITANSIDELLQKINNMIIEDMSDYVLTDAERQVGQGFDMRL